MAQALQQPAEGVDEPVVLGVGADRHPQRASRPSDAPARTSTPRSRSPRSRAASSTPSGRCSQTKFASDSATHSPSAATALLELEPRRDRLRHPPLDLVLVLQRLDRGRLGGRVQVERLADLVDRDAERPPTPQSAVADAQRRRARRPSRTSAAAPGSGSGAAARPRRTCRRGSARTRSRPRRGSRRRAAGPGRRNASIAVEPERGRRRVVRVADQHQPRRHRDLGGDRVEVVAVLGVERHLDRARARGGREVRIDAERGPRVDDLGARLEQRLAGREQDVARAVAEGDPRRRDPVAVRQRPAQRLIRRVRDSGWPRRAPPRPPRPPAAAARSGDSLEASIATSAPRS